MIIVYHNGKNIVETIVDGKNEAVNNLSIVENIIHFSKKHEDKILVWCHLQLKENLNLSDIQNRLHHKKMMMSYHPFQNGYLDKSIGYVEESPFIKVAKKVTYPTWQMSSCVGAINTTVINRCSNQIHANDNFDYFLNSFAKLAMPLGLFCYSEPKLLKGEIGIAATAKPNKNEVFKFIKQHYKTRWIFLLLLDLFLYERKIPLIAFFRTAFYKKRVFSKIDLDKIEIQSSKKSIVIDTIDVIIPTIGRKEYLFDVLKDLTAQTHLPKNVIIVEQNPQKDSQTELDYLTNIVWPFKIKPIFTHQPGACNARNICLSLVESEFVFFADDDNRFETNLIAKTFDYFNQLGCDVIQTAYPQQNEYVKKEIIFQNPFFGAGNAFLKKSCLNVVKFNSAFEFGYGEDNDFGCQLRNEGFDIIYISELLIKHLKAPMGGFRTKPVFRWSHEIILPKPSPTVMLYNLLHNTKEQLLGYKTVLFFKFYKSQSIKNPTEYYHQFKMRWNKSIFWANELNK